MIGTDDTIKVGNAEFRIFHQSHSKSGGFSLLHSHAFPELFFCLSGEITVSTETSDLNLCAGDILLVPQGLTHCLTRDRGEWESVCLELSRKRSGGNASGWFRYFSAFTQRLYRLENRPDLCRELSETLTDSYSLNGLGALRFLAVFSKFPRHSAEPVPKENTSAKVDLAMMTLIENTISNGIREQLTANELAERLHISVRQLERIVRNRYGSTLHEVITAQRIRVAQTLLCNTDMKIPQIRDAVGFTETKTFYRAFRRVSGTTPASYRKQNAAKDGEATDLKASADCGIVPE